MFCYDTLLSIDQYVLFSSRVWSLFNRQNIMPTDEALETFVIVNLILTYSPKTVITFLF